MKIGLISDTHIPARATCLPKEVYSVFRGVEQILHAGDIEEAKVLEELSGIAPVTAVSGNMDLTLSGLPHKQELQLGDYRIGLIHGAGYPRHQIRDKLRKEFENPDVIVFGHTHQPFCAEEDGILFLNPGSPTDHWGAPFCSLGLLWLQRDGIRGEIIPL